MRFATMTLIAALSAAAAERNVTVCLVTDSNQGIFPARMQATKMFAAIGVTLHWRLGLDGCPAEAIAIELSSRTPANLKPGATAYALPYEGMHIVVFYDRIVESRPKPLVKPLLAHVLVHEITHILEGIVRHSASGIMKASWTQKDYDEMARKPLDFAKEDIDLIYHGLAMRAQARVNAAPASVAGR